MKRLFDPRNRHLAIWVWIYDPESPKDRDKRPERPSQARATPLHYSAFCGIHDVVKFLIVERSQDVNARGFDEGETPLILACRNSHLEVARVLLEHDADIEARDTGGTDWSPLESASSKGHVDVVRFLLDHGADVKAQDKYKNTSLHVVSFERDAPAIAQVLLERGADANARDHQDWTPLHRASNNGFVGCARVLLEHGVDVDPRDDEDETPLFKASRHGHLGVAQLLLQYKADVHARDDQGRTPFQIASQNEHHEVMQLLLEHGGGDQRNAITSE
jgi:ankyrin repeat protein